MRLLLFATLDFYTKPNPAFHLLTALVSDVLKNGDHVHLVGIEEKGLSKHIPDVLENNPNFSYSLIPMKPVKKSNLVMRYLSGIAYSIKARRYLKKYIPESDVVFVRSSPTVYFNLLSVRKYTKNQKVLYGIQDMFPGSTIACGKMPHRWMQKFFYWIQKKAYDKADVISVISDDMKQKVLEQGVPEEKIVTIVNWFDDEAVREIPWDENKFVKKYKLDPEKFYVQYAGTIGYVFDYKMVLDVAEKLKEDSSIVFQIIGEGSQKEAFIEEANKKNLDNIEFLPLEPQEMVPHVYSACSVCFIPLKAGIIGNSVPSKAGLLMACRRPIITTADENSHYNKMINEEKIGFACSTEAPDDVVKAIKYMKENVEFRKQAADKGYNYGKDLYSRTENTKKFINLFERLSS